MINVACQCGKVFTTDTKNAGKKGKCPVCGAIVQITSENRTEARPDVRATTPSPTELAELAEAAFDLFEGVKPAPAPFHAPAPPEPAKKRYKVLTQKDKWFSGKFDPERLEQAMNAYADQGWVVRSAVTASIPGFGGNRDELIIIMER